MITGKSYYCGQLSEVTLFIQLSLLLRQGLLFFGSHREKGMEGIVEVTY
jgi:hypothetical protein